MMPSVPLLPPGTPLADPAERASATLLRRGSAPDRQAVQKQAVEFEAVYLAQMLEPMFAGVQAEAPFGGGVGEEAWRSLQVREFGRALAQGGGIGLADAVARELLRAQEAGGGTPR